MVESLGEYGERKWLKDREDEDRERGSRNQVREGGFLRFLYGCPIPWALYYPALSN